ncbi:MAG: spondin domain-containing protein [Gammaproteobacteria bacterium]|nr:spondin domain-containing protein [Gammaproteobacteria bacterium]
MRKTILTLGLAASTVATSAAFAADVEVRITNLAPNGGIYLTPVWAGFHNGSFDSYNGGTASATELERLAEDGNTAPISETFNANGTLVPTQVTQTGTRQDDTLGTRPFGPGREVSATFNDLDLADANRYFSYASMILPTSDYYIANGSPTAYDLSQLAEGETRTIIIYGTRADNGNTNVNDAGTEVNDFNTSAGNGFFPGLTRRSTTGQSGPDQGADQNGANANVTNGTAGSDPFRDFDENAGNGAGFLNIPDGFDTIPLNFNDPLVYTGRGELNDAQQGNIPAVALIEITRQDAAANTGNGGGGAAGLGVLLGMGLLTGLRRRKR